LGYRPRRYHGPAPDDSFARCRKRTIMADLRERGIYRLRGVEYIASTSGYRLQEPIRWQLYTLQAWMFFGAPEYEIDREGRLTSAGGPTSFTADDLCDTGRDFNESPSVYLARLV
jgi:hypothetical protein